MDEQEIVIHGGGYVGLIGGVHMAVAGVHVIFYDPDQTVVDAINAGKPKANEYLGYINDDFWNLSIGGLIKATTDYDSIKHKSVHFLAVPTERGDIPSMDIVRGCIERLHESVPNKGLIIVESTLQPGTIDSLHLPRVYDGDLFLAVCPRLDWFADSTKNVTTLPRIIGGVTPMSTVEATFLLSKICRNIKETNHRVAEFAKAGQNALYFVQIMAAYQMAGAFHDTVDMNEVLEMIGVHWRLPQLYLGTGTSGRCVAMGAKYLLEAAGSYELELFEKALYYDKNWRGYIADKLVDHIDNNPDGSKQKILVMGIAYRPNFSDFGYSAGLDIAKMLQCRKYDVSIHDPIVTVDILSKQCTIPFRALNNIFDVILLATAHDSYLRLPLETNLWRKGQFVLDATGAWEEYRELFTHYEVQYVRVGEQGWLRK